MSRKVTNYQARGARFDNGHHYTATTNFHHIHKPCPPRAIPHLPHQTAIDIDYSDSTTIDTYYDFCEHDDKRRESRHTYSDESGSVRLPYQEFDEESRKACSRNSCLKPNIRRQPHISEVVEERLYHEIDTPCDNFVVVPCDNVRRMPPSRTSDRPQSSLSSGVAASMVYGCGGKCQTCETVCYFFLQLAFTMGILIGVSLIIAGTVLRNSAAKNLQVLVSIGILISLVCAFLLTIQCRARSSARRRIKAIQAARQQPIRMETLNIRTNPVQNLDRLPSIRESQRLNYLPPTHNNTLRKPPIPELRVPERRVVLEEVPGIPWWRRREERS